VRGARGFCRVVDAGGRSRRPLSRCGRARRGPRSRSRAGPLSSGAPRAPARGPPTSRAGEARRPAPARRRSACALRVARRGGSLHTPVPRCVAGARAQRRCCPTAFALWAFSCLPRSDLLAAVAAAHARALSGAAGRAVRALRTPSRGGGAWATHAPGNVQGFCAARRAARPQALTRGARRVPSAQTRAHRRGARAARRIACHEGHKCSRRWHAGAPACRCGPPAHPRR